MHPILEDRRRLALYLLAWLLAGVLLTIGLQSEAEWLTSAAVLLPLCLLYSFIGLSTWYLCRAFPIDANARLSTLVAVQVAAAATASAIWLSIGYLWAEALDGLVADLGAQPFYAQQRPALFVVGALLYWLAAAGHYMLIAFEASREADVRAFQQTVLAREAELKALRAQIDPHFIFNSLHSISALTATDAAAARKMCILLADFLRDTLRLGSNARIPFADEWALAERFLAIEQIRLGSRLQISRETDPHAVGCEVPHRYPQPPLQAARLRDRRRVCERVRSGEGGRRAESGSHDARHPDAEARRLRRARAGGRHPCHFHHGVRQLCRPGLRRARRGLSLEALQRRAVRGGARPRPWPHPVAGGAAGEGPSGGTPGPIDRR